MRYKGNHFDYSHQTFSQLFSVDGKKNGQPRQTTRNFGGMIADNHFRDEMAEIAKNMWNKYEND